MFHKKTNTWALSAALLASVALPAGATSVFSSVGADAAAVQGSVDAFRAALGANNGLGACATANCLAGLGRREINWDAVPDNASTPNAFSGGFFNQASGAAPRIRGARFTTTGSFAVSADSDSDTDGNPGPLATEFGNLDARSAEQFAAFSAQRIFGLLGTNTMDVLFDVAGSPGTAATVRGFGVVFTDVELANLTKLDFFDAHDNLLRTEFAQAFPFPVNGDSFGSFSFVGVVFDAPLVARVHITSGDFDVAFVPVPGGAASDIVAMDDFIYGEPTVVPLPPSALLLGASLLSLALARRART